MLGRENTKFCITLTVSLVVALNTKAQTVPANIPPLGILFTDITSEPSSSDRKNPFPRHDFRPLGILIGDAPAPTKNMSLQQKPFVQPSYTHSNKSIKRNAFQPQQHKIGRPLGVLLAPTPKNERQIAPSLKETKLKNYSSRLRNQKTTSATFVHPVPSDASLVRPLGSVFKTVSKWNNLKISTPAKGNISTHPLKEQKFSGTKRLEESEPPIHFYADQMSFDRETRTITATGNVEVRHGVRTLEASKITYYQDEDEISAFGNVLIREPTGERIFGEQMEVSGDLKKAIIHNIGLILKDNSRIAANAAKHTRDEATELRNAVYSPCKLCSDKSMSAPLWQIKAVKVIHNTEQKTIEYKDAWLEFFGLPVFYTPYFRHMDPTLKRKTGFLFPKFGNSSDFGTIIETPFYWAISDYEDMTVKPIITTKEIPTLALQYRKKASKGELSMDSSISGNTGDDFTTEEGKFGIRGHIIAETRFDLNRTWRWGADLQRSTDDTYLRRYNFGSPASLNSQVFVEGFKNQSYFSAKSMLFQGLETNDEHSKSPVILPLIHFNHVSEQHRLGGRFIFDGNFLALTRAAGTDTRRLALHSRWESPFRGPFGDLYQFDAGLKTDFYHTNSLIRRNNIKYTGLAHRLFPYANLDWKLPLLKPGLGSSQILEPIASITIAPNGGNSDKIPNEDSTDFEFDEASIFSINRLGGIDRVEGGARINYGIKWGIFGKNSPSSSAFIGQTYRLRSDSTFYSGSGLEENLSNIVGSVSIEPSRHLKLLYRTRLASDNFSPNRNELNINAGVPAAHITANYIFLDQQMNSEFAGREEATVSFASKFDKYWRASLNSQQDIQRSEMRSVSLNATYEDECTVFKGSINRTFFEDRDLKPNDSITFHLILKTVGEVKNTTSMRSD